MTATALAALLSEAGAAIAAATDLGQLDAVRVRFTGRRSDLATIQRSLADLPVDDKRTLGAAVNQFRADFEQRFESRREQLAAGERRTRLAAEQLDVTLPPRRVPPGRPHLLTQITDEICDTFIGLGYRVAEGPEVESVIFNFDLLNIPEDHPARQDMDTIYVRDDPRVALRPHTSPVQARTLLAQRPPVAIVVPGRVYRQDAVDATHSPVFTQVEGLAVAEGLTMADLRGTLLTLARSLFGPDREVRMRPSFFPFTEPSAEIDVSCGFCARDGSPCRVCSGTGWIEILGSGMVDPQVLIDCGHDPDVVSGFAFGLGVERVAMLRHGIADVREFFEPDVRALGRF